MDLFNRIADKLGIFEEVVDEETQEDDKDKKNTVLGTKVLKTKTETIDSSNREPLFAKKKTIVTETVKEQPKTLTMPNLQKQVRVVVIEPESFDDSQKIADYMRNNQPVVVNFEGVDPVLIKRMTDFISGTIYALSGSMKKIGRNILVCAPKNVDIDAGVSIYDEKGGQGWKK